MFRTISTTIIRVPKKDNITIACSVVIEIQIKASITETVFSVVGANSTMLITGQISTYDFSCNKKLKTSK